MKIVDLTEFYSERGGGVRSHLTVKGHVLCQLGHHATVVAPGPRDETRTLTSVPEGGRPKPAAKGSAQVIRVKGPALPYDPTYHLFFRLDKVHAVLTQIAPDVVDINSPYLAAAAALTAPRRAFGIRTFTWHADFIDTYLRGPLERGLETGLLPPPAARTAAEWALAPAWEAVRRLTSACDATFVAGRAQVEKLRRRGLSRLVHLPFGVDQEIFRPDAAAASPGVGADLRSGLPPGAVLLAGVGRFAVEKQWPVVLEGLALAAPRIPSPLALVLYGDGPERRALEDLARRLGLLVRFQGFESDRRRLAAGLASADGLVHGCPFETFGLGVAEAVCCGLPAVVPDEGGAPESIDPTCAETFPAGDPQGFAAALESLLRRDQGQLRQGALAARTRIATVEGYFQTLVAHYGELLARRRSEGRP